MTPPNSNTVEQHSSSGSCLVSSTRALAASAASLVHLSGSPEEEDEEMGGEEVGRGGQTTNRGAYRGRYLEEVDSKIPTYQTFERKRYAFLCDELTLSARHYQPGFLVFRFFGLRIAKGPHRSNDKGLPDAARRHASGAILKPETEIQFFCFAYF